MVFYGFRNVISQLILPQLQPNYYFPQSHFWLSLKRLWLSIFCSMGQQAVEDGLGDKGFQRFPQGEDLQQPPEAAWGHLKVPEMVNYEKFDYLLI